jgi:hypothetical protein
VTSIELDRRALLIAGAATAGAATAGLSTAGRARATTSRYFQHGVASGDPYPTSVVLKSSGRWDSSVVVVLADHSMDWSRPDRVISLQPALDADPLLAGNVVVAQNGGADLLYWTGPEARRTAALERMRDLARATPGVLSVRRPARLRLDDTAGDLVVYCRSGWRFADPAPRSPPWTSPRPWARCSGSASRAAGTTGAAGGDRVTPRSEVSTSDTSRSAPMGPDVTTAGDTPDHGGPRMAATSSGSG